MKILSRLIGLVGNDWNGGAEGDRTPDLMTASHVLSHLSYSPTTVSDNR